MEGSLEGDTITNINDVKNEAICLRELPEPPNIDAGEGVIMMFATMRAQGLYPPFYSSRRDSIVVYLLNEERPPIWEQVSDWIDRNGFITNGNCVRLLLLIRLRLQKCSRSGLIWRCLKWT